jgi:membrane protease YdiL (CAAX protease family)
MQLVDHIFIVLLFVLQPVYGAIEARRYEAQEKAGKSLDRIRFYRQTALLEWAFLAVLGTAWYYYERPIPDLGFVAPGGPGFWIGVVLLGLLIGYLVYTWRVARKAGDEERAAFRQSVGTLKKYLPQTRPELRSFYQVSVTAGIVEEIVYRGFVVWYLTQFIPLWPAVILSSVGFGLAHSYQGAGGILRVSLVGLGFGILYVVSGSIWLPIIAHVLADVIQGAMIFDLLQKRPAEETPGPGALDRPSSL